MRGVALIFCMLVIRATSADAAQASSKLVTIHIRGSQLLLPLAQEAAQQYMEQHANASIVVRGSSTAAGIKALLDGTADIALVSGSLQSHLHKEFERGQLQLDYFTIAQNAIAVYVHKNNPVQNLSLLQLSKIYRGRVRNWSEVGGMNSPILAYADPPLGELHQNWKRTVLGEKNYLSPLVRISKHAQGAPLNLEVNGLMYGLLQQGQSDLRAIAIEGALPDALAKPTAYYALRIDLLAAYRNTTKPAINEFLNFFQLYAQEKLEQIKAEKNHAAKASKG